MKSQKVLKKLLIKGSYLKQENKPVEDATTIDNIEHTGSHMKSNRKNIIHILKFQYVSVYVIRLRRVHRST